MPGPFRIENPKDRTDRDDRTSSFDVNFREYLTRLLKMIPGEIVGLYMIGNGFIQTSEPVTQAIWIVVCIILIVIVRIYGTRDPDMGKESQPVPVFISTVAFIIWVYWLGGPFKSWQWHNPTYASLAILVWSFVIPIFYHGPREKMED